MMRVLITGGAGFLGSHLAERFLGEGHKVIVMDNLVTGDVANIAHLFGRDDFRFVKHDVTNYIYVDGPLGRRAALCLPGQPHRLSGTAHPDAEGGRAGHAQGAGPGQGQEAREFLLASTSEVYGDPLVHPQTEDYWGNVNPVGPRGVYDEAKRFAEAMTMAYHRYHGVDTRIVRIFNTYGPRMRLNDGRAVPNFIGQALRGRADLTVFGDGCQTRSFLFRERPGGRASSDCCMSEVNDPVNIGNPRRDDHSGSWPSR